MNRKHIAHLRSQRGAALVVGMLLLLVLTVLAISGMNTASTELVMAGNTQFRENAFQAAETGISQALINGAFNPGVPAPETLAATVIGTTDTYSAVIARQLDGAAQPALWGSTWDSFSTFHFEIASAGAATRSAATTNRQGVAVIAPKDPTVPPLDPASTALTP
jgi:type IV pilus assembly protein PilX